MTPMRVCLVSREVAPFWGAGIGTYVAEMARAWAAAGHEVHILTAGNEAVRRYLSGEHGSPDPLPGIRVCVSEEVGPRAESAFQRHAWGVYRSLQAMHAQRAFDYIEFPDYWAEGMFALPAKRTLGAFPGAALGVRLHTPTRICRELNGEAWLDMELAALQCAEERAIRDADVVISPTAALLERVGTRDDQARAVVPYPFDAGALRAVTSGTGKRSSAGGSPEVLYFGRLERRKGVELIVAAGLRLLSEGVDVRLRFIGGDTRTGPSGTSMRNFLTSLVPQEHDARFAFEEPRTREQLASAVGECIASGGVCCFPSLWENFPNACIEAMAMGAPVVGSDAGGMAEIIDDRRSGILFKGGDAGELAAKLRTVLEDESLRRRIAAGAPARIAELCNPAEIVVGTIEAVRAVPRTEPPTQRPLDITILREQELGASNPLSGINAAPTEWVIFCESGVDLDPSPGTPIGDSLASALALNPEASVVVWLAQDGRGLHVPAGLEPELLLALAPGAIGACAVRRDAVRAIESLPDLPRDAQLTGTLCALAHGGLRGILIPEPLLRAAPRVIPDGTREAAQAQLAAHFAASPALSVAWRISVARFLVQHRAQLRETAAVCEQAASLSSQLLAAEQRIAALEEHLASLRYKLADRVNDAMKSAGVHGIAKAVVSRAKRGEGRP
jgi:glycosyltransferase involved in cell wall biosynthesis